MTKTLETLIGYVALAFGLLLVSYWLALMSFALFPGLFN